MQVLASGVHHTALCARSRPKQRQPLGAEGLALLDQRQPINSASAGLGPMAALRSLDERRLGPDEKLTWLEESRLDAILGASSCSHKSVRSGIRCWMAFVGTHVLLAAVCPVLVLSLGCADKYDPVKKRYFPPPLDLLLSWTTIFRSGQTLRNYLGYVQTGCLLFNVSVKVGAGTRVWSTDSVHQCGQVFEEPALKKAKRSVDKALNFKRREKMFISRLGTYLAFIVQL